MSPTWRARFKPLSVCGKGPLVVRANPSRSLHKAEPARRGVKACAREDLLQNPIKREVAGVASNTAGAALSRELTAFLVEFSISLHKHAIYPTGHPSLEPAAERVTDLAKRLLQSRSTLAFGVARHQLIIDGVATDANHPVLRRLAETLHHHHLGALSILPGVDSHEIYSAFRYLSAESASAATAEHAIPAHLPDWTHLRFHPLTLDRLELVDSDDAPASVAESEPARRRAQLWIGLANAAMASEAAVLDPSDAALDPDDVAKAIDGHPGTAAYDQVIIGYLVQIAEELKSSPAADHGSLRRRTARLIRSLQPETLQRLVTMGGNVTQRRTFVMGATTGMAMDSVVKILKAAAEASGQTISHGLMRMLSKLGAHAERGREHTRPVAEIELREQVDSLLTGWDLDDPAPDGYAKALQHLATTVALPEMLDDERSEYDVNPMHVVQTALEVGGSGPLIERAIDRAIDAGHLHSLHTLLTFLPPGATATADLIRTKLSGPRAMASLVAREPVDLKLLDELYPSVTIDGYEVLVDALTTTNNRGLRRKLLERLSQTDLKVAPVIIARLDDERWYVQRNLLLLLERLKRLPAGFSTSRWTQHADPRVRYHGFSLQLTIPEQHEAALRAALGDTDERVTRLALSACQDGCPRSVLAFVASLAKNAHVSQGLRILAVNVLAARRDRYALEAMLPLIRGGSTWFGRPKLASRTPVVLAVLRALSDAWSTDPEANRMLLLARNSSDPELRHAAEVVRA